MIPSIFFLLGDIGEHSYIVDLLRLTVRSLYSHFSGLWGTLAEEQMTLLMVMTRYHPGSLIFWCILSASLWVILYHRNRNVFIFLFSFISCSFFFPVCIYMPFSGTSSVLSTICIQNKIIVGIKDTNILNICIKKYLIEIFKRYSR